LRNIWRVKQSMKQLDYLLDRITMYRLVLYYLILLILVAFLISLFGFSSVNPWAIILTTVFILSVSYVTNKVFSYVFKVPSNVESVYITALILACIITPIRSFNTGGIGFVFFAAVLAQASKYILAIKGKHIFNPVAIAVILTTVGLQQSASWWIGNGLLTPFIIIGGLLILRKTRREYMAVAFYTSSLILITFFGLINHSSLVVLYTQVFLHSPFFFFAYIMLTEPLTSPTKQNFQIAYGFLVGLLFPPQLHIFGLYSTPELALIIGNIFSYFVSSKERFILHLHSELRIAPSIIDFIFKPQTKLKYAAGQYIEWTFSHPKTDSRGNRRYFTLSSSPTEEALRIGVKFYENGSSYKKNLSIIDKSMPIMLTQLAGDFILPKDQDKKLVFIAGGIGITPFRSMLKFLIDTKDKRDIVTFFSNSLAEDIIYKDILEDAERTLSTKTFYTLTNLDKIPTSWEGGKGRITSQMIMNNVPDWKERLFYLSGPHSMVTRFESELHKMGVQRTNIKKDFFPGFV